MFELAFLIVATELIFSPFGLPPLRDFVFVLFSISPLVVGVLCLSPPLVGGLIGLHAWLTPPTGTAFGLVPIEIGQRFGFAAGLAVLGYHRIHGILLWLEPGEGVEPPTYGLRGRSSTTELSGLSENIIDGGQIVPILDQPISECSASRFLVLGCMPCSRSS